MTRSTDIPASGLEAYKWAKELRERLDPDGYWYDSDDVMLMRLAVLADREMAAFSQGATNMNLRQRARLFLALDIPREAKLDGYEGLVKELAEVSEVCTE